MKRITLLNPPARERVSRDYYCGHVTKGNYYWPQIDMLVLSGVLSEKYELQVLDAIVEGLTANETHRRIEEFAPDVVVSMVAAVSWSGDIAFLGELKSKHNCRVIVTGDFPRGVPELVLEGHPVVDAILLNFADSDIVDYIDGPKNGMLKNLHTREDIKAVFVNSKTFSYPPPRHDLFPLKKYRIPQNKHHPFTLVLTDFGCVFKCGYCYFERVPLGRRDPENVRAELEMIRDMGIRELMIHDQSFGAIKKQAIETCELIRGVSDKFSWCCEMRVDSCDEDVVAAMRAAGCNLIMFGVETPNEEVLAKHAKRQTVAQMKAAFELCRKYKIRTLAHFIVGLTGETIESTRRMMDFSIELNPDIASFNIARPAWNTSQRDEIVERGWIKEKGIEIANVNYFPVWESPDFPRDEMWRLRNEAMRRFYLRPSYIARQLFRVRTLCEAQTLIREGWHMFRQLFRFRKGVPDGAAEHLAAEPEAIASNQKSLAEIGTCSHEHAAPHDATYELK